MICLFSGAAAVAGEVHVPADGDELPELQAAGHAAGVANAESHEDDRGDRRLGVHDGLPPGLQETRPVPRLWRTVQSQVHGPVARQLETGVFPARRTVLHAGYARP